MAKLTRVTGKVFAGEADASEVGQFGSAKAGNPTNTTDIATIQQLAAYEEGWGSAVISNRNFPPMEEVNGILKNISYQTCYLLQEGVPTYDAGTEYSNTSLVKTVNAYGVLFYLSLQDGNIGHALSESSWWERVYFQNGYEGNITANRSLTLSGAVSGTVSYELSDSTEYALTINTSGHSKTVSLTGAVTGSATLDTGNANAVSIATTQNKYLFDGQWVFDTQLLSQATGQGTYPINLSSYLPNDNYSYEVKVCYIGYRSGGRTNSLVSICPTNLIPTDISLVGYYPCYGACSFDGEHAENGNIEATVVVDSNRTFYLGIASYPTYASYLAMTAYRRLGTNS